MNDRIAQMAREAGASFDPTFESVSDNPMWVMSPEELAAFARLVAEDCANFVEPDSHHRQYADEYLGGKEGIKLLDGVAQAIRARYK